MTLEDKTGWVPFVDILWKFCLYENDFFACLCLHLDRVGKW